MYYYNALFPTAEANLPRTYYLAYYMYPATQPDPPRPTHWHSGSVTPYTDEYSSMDDEEILKTQSWSVS